MGTRICCQWCDANSKGIIIACHFKIAKWPFPTIVVQLLLNQTLSLPGKFAPNWEAQVTHLLRQKLPKIHSYNPSSAIRNILLYDCHPTVHTKVNSLILKVTLTWISKNEKCKVLCVCISSGCFGELVGNGAHDKVIWWRNNRRSHISSNPFPGRKTHNFIQRLSSVPP